MTKLIYNIFILPITLLPFRLLYIFSDVLYFIFYKLLRYRTSVVSENLRNSFPEKSKAELKHIESEFYKHLCDIICESFKVFNIKREEIFERCVYEDLDLIEKYKDRNICIVGGHYNNYEYAATTATGWAGREVSCLFSKLSNEFFNNRIAESRSQFGLQMIQKDYAKEFFSKKHEKPFGLIFGADQSPTYSKNVIWMNFLNQETACFFGPEKYAKENDMVVIYTRITKTKRGYYKVNFELVTDKPLLEPHGEITVKHNRILEKDIIKNPQYWLWTHKRWKRTRRPEEVIMETTYA
ncbi:lysophospholipid acyltransferase family protein [Flammeovirga aprica]|uniref:Acetyltransferase n=1 Tax=Flammeovirga aprica JL-4 TaxID=694437 RepID=A0A7X9RYI1_9BACT|nr:lysophospholipid acyltransferase family protein [Flammeovirga aprica]NME70959.1 acetyltransferase [Flammeovirga aprica JL-4]